MNTFEKLTEVLSDLKLLGENVNVVVRGFHSYFSICLEVLILNKEQIKTLMSYNSLEEIEADGNKVLLIFRIDK